jgi:hypothetical protein
LARRQGRIPHDRWYEIWARGYSNDR